MAVQFDHLAPGEADMLKRMCADYHPDDAVGLELAEFRDNDHRAAHALVEKRMVTLRMGWEGTFWFVLTAEGRQLCKDAFGSTINR